MPRVHLGEKTLAQLCAFQLGDEEYDGVVSELVSGCEFEDPTPFRGSG